MKTILVVDDSTVMVMSFKKMLEVSGMKVETSYDGVQAMAHLNDGLKPDLIITDINMPNMDGIEFIKQARAMLRFTPILALTTETQSAMRDEAKRSGATGWLVKPVKGPELMDAITQVLPGA